MADAPSYPDFGTEELDGWSLVDERVETLFQLSAATVRGATRRYEDAQLRATVREATAGELDREWRFASATRLGFSPSLPPGTMSSLILPSVRAEARRTFQKRLAERGIEDVRRRTRERMRVRSGNRARLTCYEGTDTGYAETDRGDDGVPVAGWVGAWHDGTDFLVVTGGYPECRLGDELALSSDDEALSLGPAEFREELFDLLRTVE